DRGGRWARGVAWPRTPPDTRGYLCSGSFTPVPPFWLLPYPPLRHRPSRGYTGRRVLLRSPKLSASAPIRCDPPSLVQLAWGVIPRMKRPVFLLLIALTALGLIFSVLIGSVRRWLAPLETTGSCPASGVLSPGTVSDHALRSGAVDSFALCLRSDDFLYLVVDQHGVDVVATLTDSDDQKLLEVDTPNGAQGPESLRFMASHSGLYRLEVRSLDAGASGLYTIRILALRPATGADRTRAAAARDYDRAERLRGLGGALSLRKALVQYRAALSNWEGAGETFESALTLRRIGQTSYALSSFQDARTAFSASLERFRQLGDGAQEIKLLNDFGAASRRLDRPRVAEASYEQALHLARGRSDRLGEVTALNNLGVLYDAEGEPQRALDAYTEVLSAWRSLGNRAGEAATLHNLGSCYSLLGWLQDSLGNFRQALGLHQQALTAFRMTKVPHSEAFALLGIARARRYLGDLEGSLAAIREALGLVESLRGETRSPTLRTSFLAVRYDFFEMAIELLMQLDAREPGRGFAAQALEVSEHARARSLLDGIEAARSCTPSSPALLERERTVRAELAEAERVRRDLVAVGAPAQQLAAVDRRLRALLLENDESQARPAGVTPDPEPLRLEEIRRRVLGRDTALLEIAMGEKQSYIWLADQETLVARVLPGRATLEELARRAGALLPRSRERSVQRQAVLAADALSQVLLGPI